MVPLYLKYMGSEAYGLVGFFAMLQAWFNLLDMGLIPALARETARFRGGALDAQNYLRLIRSLHVIFLLVAFVCGIAIIISAKVIASNWLNVRVLPISEVQFAVQAMAISIALRWLSGLHRAVIAGSEKLVWLSSYNTIISTLKFVCILPVFAFIGTSPKVFFSYQLLVAVVEISCLAIKANAQLPAKTSCESIGWSLAPVKPLLKFSLTIAISSLVWVLVRQTDKLLLSKLLPLSDYGYFTLAVIVAGVVITSSGPISGALIPRLAHIEAQGDHAGLIALYRSATQLACVIALPVAFMLAAFAEQVLWAWTGDVLVAKSSATILKLYSVGNGIMIVSAFPYYLQFAKGDLRLHLIGNVIFVVILIPMLVVSTWKFGGDGAGWAWLISNILYLLCWIPLVHKRIEPGLHLKWLSRDVLPMLGMAGAGAYASSFVTLEQRSRALTISQTILLGILVLFMTSLMSKNMREKISVMMRQILFK